MAEQYQQPLFPGFAGSQSGMPAFWTAFGSYAAAMEPVGRTVARCNLEMSSLMGERVRAYAAIPETLQRCRTPVDVMQAQVAFWQEAGRQYQDAARRMSDVWRDAFGAFQAMPGAPGVDRRDYITFPEPRQEAGDDRRRTGDARRAA